MTAALAGHGLKPLDSPKNTRCRTNVVDLTPFSGRAFKPTYYFVCSLLALSSHWTAKLLRGRY
jgi:hypothetical protein